jgi:hypothetical protein
VKFDRVEENHRMQMRMCQDEVGDSMMATVCIDRARYSLSEEF